MSGALAEEIHAAALANGMVDLKRYSALLLAEGLTTVDEVTSGWLSRCYKTDVLVGLPPVRQPY